MNREQLGITEEHAKAIIATLIGQSIPTLNGCIERQKTPNKDGYTNYKIAGKIYGAHRLMYMLQKGLSRSENVVMHSCDNRRCVNIDHLSEGDNRKNTYDCISKHRTNWQVNPIPRVPIEPSESRAATARAIFSAIRSRLAGVSVADIAKAEGFSERTITVWLRECFGTANVEMKDRPVEPDQHSTIYKFKAARGEYVKRVSKEAETRKKFREESLEVIRMMRLEDAKNKRIESARAKMEAKTAVRDFKAQRDAKIVKMSEDGMDYNEIAVEMGLSGATTRSVIIRERGVEFAKCKKRIDKEAVAAFLAMGNTYEEAAAEFGISTATARVAEKMYPNFRQVEVAVEKRPFDITRSLTSN